MMTIASNKRKLYYAEYLANVPEYVIDDEGNRVVSYITDDGTVIYAQTGEKKPVYSTPQEMYVNYAESGGEAEAKEFGLSVADYEAILLYGAGEYPLKESFLVWADSQIEYEYGGEEIEVEVDGEIIKTKAPVRTSADFVVMKTPRSLNFERAILKAITK